MQRAVAIAITTVVIAAFFLMVRIGNSEFTVVTEPQFSNMALAIVIGICLCPFMWIAAMIQRHYRYRG